MPKTGSVVDVGPLDTALVEQYRRDGFLLLPPSFLTGDVLGTVASLLPKVLAKEGPSRILERDNTTVRSVYGLHQTYPEFREIARQSSLLGASRQLLGNDVYVHQSKINIKASFEGDQWGWHQDYIYWLQNDGIPKPDLVNVAVFLDEVTEFNGPLMFIPGSHHHGVLSGTLATEKPTGYEDSPDWVSTLTAEEKVQISRGVIGDLARANGLASPKGTAGSVLFFNPNLLHASPPNLSPFRRAVLLFVYNSVTNAPAEVTNPRPPFLSEPDVRALQPLPSENTEEMSK